MTDEITLTLPRDSDFYGIAHLVLGGLGARLQLTYEALDDLQVALASVLERPDDEGDVVVSLRVHERAVEALVGPFEAASLRAYLEREGTDELSIARLLSTVVDSVQIDERDGGAWIALTKSVEETLH